MDKCNYFRMVSRSEMDKMAAKFNVRLIETSSAEDMDSVKRLFRNAIKEALLTKVR